MRKEFTPLLISILCGGIGFFLRRQEVATVFEAESGLPKPGMPITWVLVALSVVVLALLGWLCYGTHRHRFPGGFDQAFSAKGNTVYVMLMVAAAFLAAAAGLLMLIALPTTYKTEPSGLTLAPRAVLAVLTLAAGAGMFQIGRSSYSGHPLGKCAAVLLVPSYACCVWLIQAYQANSGDPVILHYVYYLMAIVCAVLGSYHMAGFSFSQPKVFGASFFCLGAMYFILITLADGHALPHVLLLAAFYLYFAASAAALLFNARRPLGPRMPYSGGKRLLKDKKEAPQE